MNLTESEVLVHVGFPKTATTWLQDHLFSRPDRGFFAPGPDDGSGKPPVKSLGQLFYRDAAGQFLRDEDFDAMAIRAAIEPIAVPAGLVPVISNERLVGHALSAGIDRAAIARRLHAVFPEARVLLVIREQRAMLLSSYIQYLGYGGWYGIDRFLAAPSDLRAPTIDLRHWQYDRAIALYQEVFGADRVLVLPFEMFVRDNAAYVAAICRFMNATTPADLPAGRVENVSRPYVSSYCLRWLTCINRSSSANAFFPQFLSAGAGKLLDRGVKHAVDLLMPQAFERRLKRTLTEKIARRVEGLYAESNRRAALLSRLDLASYGYDCSAAATISS